MFFFRGKSLTGVIIMSIYAIVAAIPRKVTAWEAKLISAAPESGAEWRNKAQQSSVIVVYRIDARRRNAAAAAMHRYCDITVQLHFFLSRLTWLSVTH